MIGIMETVEDVMDQPQFEAEISPLMVAMLAAEKDTNPSDIGGFWMRFAEHMCNGDFGRHPEREDLNKSIKEIEASIDAQVLNDFYDRLTPQDKKFLAEQEIDWRSNA